MEAGILAILGGQHVALTAQHNPQGSHSQLLESRPFRAMMHSATTAANAAENHMPHSTPPGGMLAGAPALLLLAVEDAAAITRLTDPTVNVERPPLPDDPAALLTPLVAPAPTPAMPQRLAMQGAVTAESETDGGLWSIMDSLSGSDALNRDTRILNIIPVATVETPLPAADDAHAALTEILPLFVTSDTGSAAAQALPSLNDLTDWNALIGQLQTLYTQQQQIASGELSEEEAVPLVTLASLNPPPQLQPWLREQQIQTIQIVSPAGTQPGLPVSAPVAEAIAQDDLSMLNDNELAELDALVERITQTAARRDAAATAAAAAAEAGEAGFRNLMQQQLATLSRQHAPAPEAAAPEANTAQTNLASGHVNVHSVQHHQQAHDSVQPRFLQATPTPLSENADAADQVRVTVTQAFRAGLDRVIIQLEPAELGRVDVRLDLSQDGRTQILIQADNRDTLDLLQRDARLLERALQDAGLDADAQTMEFSLNQGSQQGESEDGMNDAIQRTYNETVEELRQPELTMDPPTGHYTLSIAQGLDIKV